MILEGLSVRDAMTHFSNELKGRMGIDEAESITKLAFEFVLEVDRTGLEMAKTDELSGKSSGPLKQIIQRLQAGEPIQYVLGETEFYGLKFNVDPNVLIPRPETEELVDWAIKSNRLDLPVVVDICTGSGCIPVALAKSFDQAKVIATDVSADALELAKKNAQINSVTVDFVLDDALNSSLLSKLKFDILTCNPPYVLDSEESLMKPNVLDHEPHLALFVPDDDALIFYRVVLMQIDRALNKGASLYFEINEVKAHEVVALMELLNYTGIDVRKDLNGKDRMVRCIV